MLRTLWGSASEAALGRSAPFPARPRAGARLSLKKVGGKNTRAPPWTRVFMAARSHSLVFVVVISDTAEGQFPPIYQDRFGTHFPEKYAEKAFYERKSPNQGRKMGGEIAPRPGQCGTNPKTSERQQAGYKTRGPGACPWCSFLRLSSKKVGLPAGVGGEPTSQGPPCNGSNGATYR